MTSEMPVMVAAAAAVGVATAITWSSVAAPAALPPGPGAHVDDMTPGAAADSRALVRDSHPAPRPGSRGVSGGAHSRVGVAPDREEASQTSARGREPVFLTIADLGVESPVTRTWMDEHGTIFVPEDVTTTGWFAGSKRLSAPYGSTVIVGHRDSATQGSGALFGIEELSRGAAITVTSRSGTQHAYSVESVEFIDKSALPQAAPRVFTRQGPHRLVLITCGGAFDEGARSYMSNIVVTALPAPADED